MPQFSDTERKICELFTRGTSFVYDGVKYTVSANSVKPTVSKGECKTDVYIPTTFDGGRMRISSRIK